MREASTISYIYIPFQDLTASIADLGEMHGVRIASMRARASEE